MTDSSGSQNDGKSGIRIYKSHWAFTQFERRALWLLSIFLISGTALRMYHNHQLKEGLDLIQVAESIGLNAEDPDQTSNSGTTFPININLALQSDLELIPGIGPVKAMAIINHIKANGAFKETSDLQNVKGIGPATLRKIEDYVVTE